MKIQLKMPRLTPQAALVIKHGLGDVGQKMWSFASMMFLITLKRGSMEIVAAHTLSLSIALFILASSVGSVIDRLSRLTAIRLAIGGQVVCVAAIAILITAVQLRGHVLECYPTELYIVFTILCIFDIAAKLAKEAAGIIIGRDWVVTVCLGDRTRLARINVWFTRIDEVFGIVAPLAISALRQVVSQMQATIAGALIYLICSAAQYCLIIFVYKHVEAIRESKKERTKRKKTVDHDGTRRGGRGGGRGRGSNGEQGESRDTSIEEGTRGRGRGRGNRREGESRRGEGRGRGGRSGARNDEDASRERKRREKHDDQRKKKSRRPDICNPRGLLTNFKKFFDYRVALAGVANSMQHLSLVSFGIVTMVYIRTQGINYLYMGVSRALVGVIAIIGSFVFPPLIKRYGLVRVGLIGICIQLLTCCGAITSMYLPAYPLEDSSSGTGTEGVNPRCLIPVVDADETLDIVSRNNKHKQLDFFDPNFIFNDDVEKKERFTYNYHDVNVDGNNKTVEGIRQQTHYKLLPYEKNAYDRGHVQLVDKNSDDNTRKQLEREETGVDERKVVKNGTRDGKTEEGRSGKGGKDGKGGKGGKDGKGGKGGKDGKGGKGGKGGKTEYSHPSASAFMLLGSLLVGSIGIYLSRISIRQLFQEEIPRNERGSVAGVQITMNTFFSTISSAIVLYASTADNFIYLVWMSLGVEISAAAVYLIFAVKYNKHRGVKDSDPYQPQHLEDEDNDTDTLEESSLEDTDRVTTPVLRSPAFDTSEDPIETRAERYETRAERYENGRNCDSDTCII